MKIEPNELLSYLVTIDNIAIVIAKYLKDFKYSILDLTGSTFITGASLLFESIPVVFKRLLKGIVMKDIAPQSNVQSFADVELILDTATAYEGEIGIICIDSTTTGQLYEGIEVLVTMFQPPILVIGESKLEENFKDMYNTETIIYKSGEDLEQLGKVYTNNGK